MSFSHPTALLVSLWQNAAPIALWKPRLLRTHGESLWIARVLCTCSAAERCHSCWPVQSQKILIWLLCAPCSKSKIFVAPFVQWAQTDFFRTFYFNLRKSFTFKVRIASSVIMHTANCSTKTPCSAEVSEFLKLSPIIVTGILSLTASLDIRSSRC